MMNMESVLILCDKGPFGTNSAYEAIRLGAGFLGLGEDIDCKVIFYGDAVLMMKNNLAQDQIGMDTLEEGLEMADLTEMPIVLVKEDMGIRGMKTEDVVEYEEVQYIDKRSDMAKIIQEYPTVFHM
jgi:sulfur relay (sulfurtransferase) DsrF/TusC family protein